MRTIKALNEYPITRTADGEPFNHERTYHYFNPARGEILDTSSLRRVDLESLGSMGMRIIAIAKLRNDKTAAIGDAQKHYLSTIDECRRRIRKLEAEKPPKERSLKAIVMANE